MHKKILHIINGDFYAGAERVQDWLALGLPKHGYEVGFAALKSGQFAAARKAQAVPLHTVPMASRFDLTVGTRLAALAHRQAYDALHAHTPRSLLAGYLAARKTGLPLFYHVHSPVQRDTEHALRNFINTRLETFCAGHARQLIAVSNSLRNQLRATGFPDDKITVVPNGVPVVKDSNDWQAPEKTWTLGIMAFFRPRKGLEILLQALAILLAEGLPLRLRIVGGFENPTYEQAVKAQAQALNLAAHLDWVGFTADTRAELRQMNIFVVPSLFGEGLPMVLLEALAEGLPVIATQVEGIPEVLTHDAGILVKAGDVAGLADAIRGAIAAGSALRTMADKGFQRQRDVYSDDAMAAGVAATYRAAGV